MKRGDLVMYRPSLFSPTKQRLYIVDRVEPENNWVFIFGMEYPVQMSLMEVASDIRNYR